MRPATISLFVAGVTLTLANANPAWDGWRPLSGARYLFHGGSLADRQLPTPRDTKLSIMVEGQGAQQIFNEIGPDLSATCSDG